jgi:hypothetical protein
MTLKRSSKLHRAVHAAGRRGVGGGLQDTMPSLQADQQIISNAASDALSGCDPERAASLPDGVNFAFDPGGAEGQTFLLRAA